MDKDKNSRNGKKDENKKQQTSGDRGRTELPGAPSKSNRQTGGNKRHERDDSNGGSDRNTTKKGANAI